MHAMFKGDGAKAFVRKSVVTALGVAVGKNYDRNAFKEGDIGIELRLDRGEVTSFTPEQRITALGVAKEAYEDLVSALGGKNSRAMFEEGDVVAFDDVIGSCLGSGDGFLWVEHLGALNRWTRMSLPLANGMVNILDAGGYRGRQGVLYEKYIRGNGTISFVEMYQADQKFVSNLVMDRWAMDTSQRLSGGAMYTISMAEYLIMEHLQDNAELLRVLAVFAGHETEYAEAITKHPEEYETKKFQEWQNARSRLHCLGANIVSKISDLKILQDIAADTDFPPEFRKYAEQRITALNA